MPLLQYKAMNDRGKTTVGRVDAVNAADLEMRLSRMGLDLINYKQIKTRRSTVVGKRVKRSELIGFCFHMEQLLGSGVPLVDGLTDLRDTLDDPVMREVIAGLVESIEGGKTFGESMEAHPRVFDTIFVNLVKAGEISGQVPEVLQTIAENLKWQDEQAAQVKKIMMYPLIVGTVIMGVIFFLMTYLVPQLVGFIENMGEELPMHTLVLIAVSDVFKGFWYLFLIVPVFLFMGLAAARKTSPGIAYFLDDLKLKIWVIGPISKKITLARFANFFAMMYASGITVLECIRISEGVMGNKAMEEATRTAGRQIAEGASISAGFEYAGLFPPLVLRMLRVGENTGALDKALRNVGYFYTREVRESIEKLETMIGPAMTFILGGLLIWVMISVLGPIYDLITKLKF